MQCDIISKTYIYVTFMWAEGVFLLNYYCFGTKDLHTYSELVIQYFYCLDAIGQIIFQGSKCTKD